jgi:hypothetical protein
MLTPAAFGEVIDHRLQGVVRRRSVRPVGFPLARHQHGYRRLVGVQHASRQHQLSQGVHQRLKLHAALADPLRQGRARDRHTGSAEDAFLAIERLVIQVLGDQNLGQQPRGRQPLVDHVRWNRCQATPRFTR